MTQTHYFNFPRFYSVILLAIFMGITVSSFASQEIEGASLQTNKTSIVFIDKSGSICSDTLVLKMYRERLASIISQNATKSGDAVIVSFIYEQTNNKANQYVFTYQPPLTRNKKMSHTEARLEKIRFNQRLQSYNKQFSLKVIEKAFSITPSRKQTNIVGSILKMHDLLNCDTNRVYSVYYFSDMVESSGFRHMSFSSSEGIHTFSDAERLAKTDFPRILRLFYLEQNCLSTISEIFVIFPAKEMDTNKAFAVIPAYWDYIFKHLGVKKINYL